MSQYNLNGFNRSPYNLKPEYNVNWAVATFYETVNAVIGVGFDHYLNINANERVTNETIMTPVRMRTATLAERVTASAIGEGDFMIPPIVFAETLSGKQNLSQIVRLAINAQETVTNRTATGFEINTEAECFETVTANVSGGKIYNLFAEGYEVVSEVAGVESVTEYVGSVAISLAPGQRLVIDAENYSVLLDGENAIETYSGDWLDNLNRNTVNISIHAATGGNNLTASILYTERYL